MPVIDLKGRQIKYSIVKGGGRGAGRRRRRYTYLRFTDDAVLEVVTPGRGSFDAEAAIREKQGWVLKHFDELSSSDRVLTDDAVMFGGKRLRIVFKMTGGREELLPDLERGEVVVSASETPRIKELVRRWFLKESSAYAVRALPALALRLHASYRRADVREMKNWGYCTHDGRLSFSWQIIALPERLREYVLCHELVHLLVHNHSGAFREGLGRVLPDYRERERELSLIVPYEA